MRRTDRARLDDILDAICAIRRYLLDASLDEPIVYDAVRMRLIEVGEAVKSIDPSLLASEPSVPWRSIAAMRDRLAHGYFDTLLAILVATVEQDLDELESAVVRLAARLPSS